MTNAVFPQLSPADLARIWKTGGQAVADLAAQHGVSKRAICRGIWYARTMGDQHMKGLAGDAAAGIARTGLKFTARPATMAAAGAAGEATLAGSLGVLAVVALVTVIAVKVIYPHTIRARAAAGEFQIEDNDPESKWSELQDALDKSLRDRARATRLANEKDERDARLRRARESARRHDQRISAGPVDDLDDFEDELIRTNSSLYR